MVLHNNTVVWGLFIRDPCEGSNLAFSQRWGNTVNYKVVEQHQFNKKKYLVKTNARNKLILIYSFVSPRQYIAIEQSQFLKFLQESCD